MAEEFILDLNDMANEAAAKTAAEILMDSIYEDSIFKK